MEHRPKAHIRTEGDFLMSVLEDTHLQVTHKNCKFVAVRQLNSLSSQVFSIFFSIWLIFPSVRCHSPLLQLLQRYQLATGTVQLSYTIRSMPYLLELLYSSYKMETLKEIIQRLGGDPYEILATQPDAEFSVLKKNYRSLALKYHPDRNKDEEATEIFIKINRAYEFLQEEPNRRLYADHIRAIEEQRQRIQAMDSQRRTLIENLKRREEDHMKAKEDLQAEAKRRKEFFEKKERQEQEHERLRQQISHEMTPQQYYEEMSAVIVKWQRGLSFTKNMLISALTPYGEIVSLAMEPSRRKAIVVFNSIQKAQAMIPDFKHALISVELKVGGERRTRLQGALKRRKQDLDLSLSSQNIARMKEIINRKSNLYFQHPPPTE